MKHFRFCKMAFLIISIELFALYLWPHSRDYDNYLLLSKATDTFKNVLESYHEYDFIVPLIFYLTQDESYGFLIIGAIGITCKIYFIRWVTPLYWFAFLFYFARFFILHDVTQIRLSLASGMLALAYIFMLKRRFINASIFIAVGFITHASIILYAPIALIAAIISNPRLLLKLIVVACTVVLILASLYDLNELYEYIMRSYMTSSNLKILDYLVDNKINENSTGIYMYIKLYMVLHLTFFFKGSGKYAVLVDQGYRMGVVILFSIAIFFLLKSISYTIAARFSEIAAPFEAVFLANALFVISKDMIRSNILRDFIYICFTWIIATFVFMPQINLLNY